MRIINNPEIWVFQNQTVTSSFTSDTIELSGVAGYAIELNITVPSSVNATVKLQGSNTGGTNSWPDIPSSSTSVSGSTCVLWNVIDAKYKLVRVVITVSSGSLTAGAYIVCRTPN